MVQHQSTSGSKRLSKCGRHSWQHCYTAEVTLMFMLLSTCGRLLPECGVVLTVAS
jgi:hypothetical protein